MTRSIGVPLLAAVLAMLAACALPRSEAPALFDLGPLRPVSGISGQLPALPPLAVAEVATPPWLDRPQMYYRLDYANDQQPLPYARSRWSMAPAQLLAQRVKARIAQAGGIALPAADGPAGVPVLRIEADDFSQSFSAPGHSVGQVALRAAVYRGRVLLGQKSFIRQAPAPTADAAGGARALAVASDAAITDMMTWLASLPLKESASR